MFVCSLDSVNGQARIRRFGPVEKDEDRLGARMAYSRVSLSADVGQTPTRICSVSAGHMGNSANFLVHKY